MTKQQARAKINEIKAKMTNDEVRLKSLCVINQLKTQKIFMEASDILVYVSYNQEVETLPFIDECLKLGKNIYVPKVYEREMKFHKIISIDELEPGKYGILEPQNENIFCKTTGLMIVPGLAFDSEFHRVGYGGGFYDRYLSKDNTFMKVALCFDFQIVDKIEEEPHDIGIDMIISESKVLLRNEKDT
jgi:5-formyltetrahydrofolate cyclo-ligase